MKKMFNKESVAELLKRWNVQPRKLHELSPPFDPFDDNKFVNNPVFGIIKVKDLRDAIECKAVIYKKGRLGGEWRLPTTEKATENGTMPVVTNIYEEFKKYLHEKTN